MSNREIGKTLMILQNQIARAIEERKTSDQLPRSQGRVLRYIYNHKENDVYQKDIEKEFNLRRPSATEVLQKLESSGMIVRISTEEDRRIKKIQISEKGEKKVQQIHENIMKMEEILRKDLSMEEVQFFFTIMDKMTKNCMEYKKEE